MGSVDSTTVVRGPAVPVPLAGTILGGRRTRLIAGAAVVLIVSGAIVATRASSGPAPVPPRTAPVSRGTVTQTVAVSGSVNPTTQTRLSFKSGGRLAETLVTVGQAVAAGQPLARLDTTDLKIALAQAKASLASAQAKYDQTVAGAAPEDVAVAQQSVDNAKKTLDETRRSTANDLTSAEQSFTKLKSGYVSAQNGFSLIAIGIATDVPAFTGALGDARYILATAVTDLTTMSTADITTAKSSMGQADSALANAQSASTNQLAGALVEWKSARDNVISAWLQFDGTVQRGTDTSGAASSYQSAQTAYTTAAGRLQAALDSASGSVTSAQSNVTTAQNALSSSTNKNDASLDRARADLLGLQTALASETQLATAIKNKLGQVNTNMATITDAIGGSYVAAQQAVASTREKATGSIQSAQNSYDSAVTSLAKTSAPPKSYDVASAYATLLGQQASLDKANNDITNATLIAPSAGVVASIGSQPGEFVAGASSNAFILLSNTSTVALHGTVGEADVAKLKLGQVATVTVDAIGTATRLTGRVTGLDPVGTIQQGVPVYGVDVTIDIPDTAMRPGMTGTANIIVASKQGVLTVPNLAIRSQSGRRFVQVLRGGQTEDVDVTFGISNDTVTEVTGGLDDGDLAVLPAPRTTAGQQNGQIRVGGPGGAPPPGAFR